ncbi:YceI family protein [Chitinophagaceae bacterium MMS25-I14]
MNSHFRQPGMHQRKMCRNWFSFILVIALTWCIPAEKLAAQRYIPTDAGSKVQFRVVNHLILSSTVNGYFKGLKGTIDFNPDNLKAASIDVSVAVATISTGIGMRDKDLKKEDYFNAEKYPVIRIKSNSVSKSNKAGTYMLSAALTMKGITKNISIPFTATPSGNGCTFKSTFTVNRKDYGVGDTKKIDEQVTVMLEVAAKKQ